MKLLFTCYDYGTLYKVLYPHVEYLESEDISNDPNLINDIIYEVYSINVYAEICRALNAGKIVFIPKSLGRNLEIPDLIIQDLYDEFSRRKQEITTRVIDHILVKGIRTDISLSLLNLLNSFSDLANAGYFVTENNRAEVYNKIIMDSIENDNGSEVIQKLENYLNAVGRISDILAPYRNMKEFLRKIDSLSTVEELDVEYENYMSSFL
jgi:hypothetical protein